MRPALLACFAALALAGCNKSGESMTEPSPGAMNTDAKAGLSVSDGRLVLPAVKGNPGAAYFVLRNGADKPATLTAVSVEGAQRAEMHETRGGTMAPLPSVKLKPGQSVEFAPGGKHVMVFGLPETLKPGGTARITLSFADGDKLTASLAVGGAGAAIADMEGMH